MKLIIDEQQALKTRDKESIEDITLSELVNLYLYIYKAKNKSTTLIRVNRIINNYLLACINPNKLIKDISSVDFDKFRNLLIANDVANPNSYISYVKDLFKLAYEYFKYYCYPAFKILPIKKQFNHLENRLKAKDIYTIEDVRKIYRVCNSSLERCLIMVLFFMGLRISEIRGLRWDSIQGNHLNISCQGTSRIQEGFKIIDPKSIFSVRSLPMPKFLIDELKNLHKINKNTIYIFQNKKDYPIGETTIRRLLVKLAKKVNIKYLHPHAWRHSCASYLLNSLNCSMTEIKEWLGHSSEEITSKIYVHLYKDKKEKIAIKMSTKKSIK